MTEKPSYEELMLRINKLEKENSKPKLTVNSLHNKIMAESSFEGISIHENGILLDANPQYFEMLGYEREELIGKNFLLHTVAPESIETIKKQIETGSISNYEAVGLRKDKSKFPVEIRAKYLEYNGQFVRVGVVRDITGRKHMEEMLKESEEKYRHLVEYAPSGLYEIDFINQKFITINEVACKYSGYTKQELLEMNPMDILTKKSAQLFGERLQRMFMGEEVSSNVEYQVKKKKKDGTTSWVELQIRLNYEGEAIKGATVVAHDISKRKQVEIQLETAKKHWEMTFDAISDWVCIIDNNHTIIRSNKASNSFVDISPKELAGKICHGVLHGTNCPIAECPAKRSFISKTREYMEMQLEDGRWIQVIVDPISIDTDTPNSAVHIVRDITHVKKQEQAIILARKSEAFSVLAGGIAHDYNNLLSIIWGNIALLEEELTDPLHKELFESAVTACRQAKDLTHQFITLSIGYSPQKSLESLERILKNILDEFSNKEEIEFSLEVSDKLPKFEVDSKMIKIALKNIVLNAVEAMPNNGKMNIWSEKINSDSKKEEWVKIFFKDSGKGVSTDAIEKLFDPYFTTKGMGTQKGSGLGLSLSQAIIKKHGGDIEIESMSGNGTTVIVTLPVSVPIINISQKRIYSNEKPVVLLMEDDPLLNKLFTLFLQKLNCDVISTGNGKEAIEEYMNANKENVSIDLLLFDQSIKGGIGGIETLNKIQQLGYKNKSIVVTGSPNSPVISNPEEYGFDGNLLKPFVKKDLEEAIAPFLSI